MKNSSATLTKQKMKEIVDVYKKLNINYKNNYNSFEKYTKYNYNERSTMTTNTDARI